MSRQFKIIKCLCFFFFFLTNKSLSTSNLTIKSIRQILLTSVTFFEMHHFRHIKILIFLILILKIKSIIKKKKKER
jgi:hypothetical protein